MDLSTAPAAIRALPLDPRGYPIPWFVATLPDGTRDLRIADGQKRFTAHRQNRCWVCGRRLLSSRAFIGGPLSVLNRRFGDAAMHPECALFSVQHCPFINGEMSRRPGRALPEGTRSLEGAILARPEFAALYHCTGLIRISPEGHFLAPPADRVEWWKDGEPARPEDLQPWWEAQTRAWVAAMRAAREH